MEIGVMHYLIVAAVLFVVGVLGVLLNRHNLIRFLLSLELVLLGVNLNFVTFATYMQDLAGKVFVLFILTVAAAEAAIGIAIFVLFYQHFRTLHINRTADTLRG